MRTLVSKVRAGMAAAIALVVVATTLQATPAGAQQEESGLFDLFNGHAASDNWTNTYLLSVLSHYVYEGNLPGATAANFDDRFEDALKANGIVRYTSLDQGQAAELSLEGAVVETDDAVIVVLRGTEDGRDQFNDVAAILTYPDGTAHSFRNGAQVLKPAVQAAISQAGTKRVWFTGHSYGGALAQDLAYLLRDEVDINGVVTFGEPQVYRALSLAAGLYSFHPLAARTELWMNDRDPVPHALGLIGASPLFPVFFTWIGDIHHISITSGGSSCSIDSDPTFPELLLDDHDTGRYSTRILNLMPRSQRTAILNVGNLIPDGNSGLLANPPQSQIQPFAPCDNRPAAPAPTLTPVVSGTAGTNGWWRSDVTVNWTTERIYPGMLATHICASTLVNRDTTRRDVNCRVQLRSGQVLNESVIVRRDTGRPTVRISNPSDGITVLRDQQVHVDYSCTDYVSGIKSCGSGNQRTDGQFLPTNSFGTKFFEVNALDRAGNTSTRSLKYTVKYAIDRGSLSTYSALPGKNTLKAGKTAWFTWRLVDAKGRAVTNNTRMFDLAWSEQVSCKSPQSVDGVQVKKTLTIRSYSQYHYSSDRISSSWAGTCRYLILDVENGGQAAHLFEFTK